MTVVKGVGGTADLARIAVKRNHFDPIAYVAGE